VLKWPQIPSKEIPLAIIESEKGKKVLVEPLRLGGRVTTQLSKSEKVQGSIPSQGILI
jgi:hypothetical protein